jgi:hypothetical protein
MPVKENKTSQYDEHSRNGALAQNTIDAFKVMAEGADDDLYTATELIKLAGIKDARKKDSKAYKSGQTHETWFISKLKVLSALGRYGVEYTDKNGVKHKPRPKYLVIKEITENGKKIPVFKLTPFGRAKLAEVLNSGEVAEEDDATEEEDDA